jgi:hypothetical protein
MELPTMKDPELDHLLKALDLPPRDASYWSEFPRRVTTRLRQDNVREAREAGRWIPRWAWAAVPVCLALVLAVSLNFRSTQPQSSPLLRNEALIGELIAMFPNRLRAILEDEQGLRLVLSEQADVPSSTPLWVKLCRGNRCWTLVTFSGQEIPVEGESIMVLADARGGVLLMGEQFAWTSHDPSSGPGGLRIQAAQLEPRQEP